MVDAGSIWVKLGLDSSGFESGLKDAKSGLREFDGELKNNSRSMLQWGKDLAVMGTAATAVSAVMINLVEQYGRAANELGDLSYQTGIATEKLQQIQYAALLSGTEISAVSTALNKLTLSMEAARDPTSAAAKAFSEIGVSTDGRTTDQVFEDTAQALVGMEDTTKRNAIAMELYGRQYKELLPLMDTYISKADEIRNHPVYTEEERKQLEDAKINWEKFTDSFTVATGKILANYESLSEKAKRTSDILNPIALGYNILTGTLNKTTSGAAGGLDVGGYKSPIQTVAEESKKSVDALTSSVSSLTTTTKSSPLWDPSVVVGSAGSEMQLFMQREMELGTDYQTALENWARGEPTRGTPMEGTLGAVTGKSTSTKSLSKPGTAAETASVKSELKDQGAAFTELNTTIKSGWSELEQTGIIHWTAMAELARTTYQYIMDSAAQAVNFAGSNPIIQKVVTLSKSGYDIDPSPLPQVTAPKLADIDFSGVQFSGGAGATGTQAGGGTTVNVEQNVTVVSPQGTPAQNAAALRKANQGLGSLVSSGVY